MVFALRGHPKSAEPSQSKVRRSRPSYTCRRLKKHTGVACGMYDVPFVYSSLLPPPAALTLPSKLAVTGDLKNAHTRSGDSGVKTGMVLPTACRRRRCYSRCSCFTFFVDDRILSILHVPVAGFPRAVLISPPLTQNKGKHYVFRAGDGCGVVSSSLLFSPLDALLDRLLLRTFLLLRFH